MKKAQFKTMAALLALCCMFVFSACGGGASSAAASTAAPEAASAVEPAATGIVIGSLEKTQSDPFSRKVNEAMNERLDELKAEGKIADYVHLDADSDVQKQLNQADDLIARKVDVIIMQPQDANGCAPIVDKCNEAGIPLVVVNARVDNVDEATAFVGSDDVNAGEIVGNFVVSQLGGAGSAQGNILHIEGAPGNSATIDRGQGLTNIISEEPGITLLASLTAQWQREQAMKMTEDWLQKYDDIQAIVSDDDDMALGSMNAVIAANRSEIMIVGVDAIDDALVAIQAGTMTATVYQDAHGQGTGGADVAYAIATGGDYEKETMIPFVLVTQENVSEFL